MIFKKLIIPPLTLITATSALGAGFQLQEKSTVGLGRAFSGEAAIGDDASIVASNPAGMVLLDDTAISVGLSYIRPGAEASGTFTPGPGAGAPSPGAIPTNSKDVGEDVVVPAIYITHKINDNLSVGFGSFTTYGLATDYSSSFLGLSVADESSLESVNFQPSIAYRVNDQFSIGAGFNILYADGIINSSAPNNGPHILNLEGDDFGYGYNIGVLYELSDTTRFGLHFRSKVDLKLEGDTDFIGSTIASIPPSTNLDTTLSVTLPETLEFSAYHELDDKWAIHGDIVWTRWSRYNGLSPQVPGQSFITSISNSPAEWKDAYRFSAGATYKSDDKLTLRAGIAYDQSPVSDSDRTLRIPDANRFWLSAGFSYAICQNYNLDFGYARIFIDDSNITDGNGTGVFNGEASGDVDIVSLGVSGSF